MLTEKKVILYQGFLIPETDARQLHIYDFTYDVDEECFTGDLETEEGALRKYNYYPSNFSWAFMPEEENY